MRALLAVYLIGFVSLCPLVCGVGEPACGSCARESSACDEDRSAPAHCPEDGDNCICEGAVPQADLRVPGPESVGLPLFEGLLPAPCPPSLLHAHHLTFDGAPSGLAAWGDSGAIRAALQIYRC